MTATKRFDIWTPFKSNTASVQECYCEDRKKKTDAPDLPLWSAVQRPVIYKFYPCDQNRKSSLH